MAFLSIGQRVRFSLAIGLFCGSMAFYPAWKLHPRLVASPFLGSENAARRWLIRTEADMGRSCIARSVTHETTHFAIEDRWLVEYRCQTHSFYLRVAFIFLAPFIAAFLIFLRLNG